MKKTSNFFPKNNIKQFRVSTPIIFSTISIMLLMATVYNNLDYIKSLRLINNTLSYQSIMFLIFLLPLMWYLPRWVNLLFFIVSVALFLPSSESFFIVSFYILVNLVLVFGITKLKYFEDLAKSIVWFITSFISFLLLKVFIMTLFRIFNPLNDLIISSIVSLCIVFYFRKDLIGILKRVVEYLQKKSTLLDCSLLIILFTIIFSNYTEFLFGDTLKLYFLYPKLVFNSGSLFQPFLGNTMFQYMPKSYENLVLLGMNWGTLGAKTIHIFIIVLFLIALIAFLRKKLELDDTFIAIYILCLMQINQFFHYMTRNSPDVLLLLILVLTFHAIKSRDYRLLLVSLILGVSVKYTYIIFTFVVLTLVILDIFINRKEFDFRKINIIEKIKKSIWGIDIKTVIIAVLFIYTLFYYFETFFKTGSFIMNVGGSGSHLRTVNPSPFGSLNLLFDFMTKAYITVSKYTEELDFTYGIFGIFIIPAVFIKSKRIDYKIFLTILAFIFLMLLQSSQTRYFYFLIPFIILNPLLVLFDKLKLNIAAYMVCILILANNILAPQNDIHANDIQTGGFTKYIVKPRIANNLYVLDKMPFQIEVNKILGDKSRGIVSVWDYNYSTKGIPYKGNIISIYALNELVNYNEEFKNYDIYMIWFPVKYESLLAGNQFLASCISSTINRVKFDFIPDDYITVYKIDRKKLMDLSEKMKRIVESIDWYAYDKEYEKTLLKNFTPDYDLSKDDTTILRLYKKK